MAKQKASRRSRVEALEASMPQTPLELLLATSRDWIPQARSHIRPKLSLSLEKYLLVPQEGEEKRVRERRRGRQHR
jgi:hypothetical protein